MTPGHAVRRGPVGDVLDLHVLGLRGELGVAVVLADEQHRQAEHGGHVGRLVEGADVAAAVTEERGDHRVLAAVGAGERGAHGDRDAGPDDAVGAQHAARQVVDVHAAAAAAAVAGGLAVQLGEHRSELGALGDRVPVPAVRGGDLVVVAQDRHHPGGDGLLADVQVQEAGHGARLGELAGGLLEQPDPHHPAVQVEDDVSLNLEADLLDGCVGHGVP